MKRLHYSLVLCAALSSFNLLAQMGNSTLTGKILGPDRQALEYAYVMLYRAGDTVLYKLEYTQTDGSFAFTAIEPGDYTLRASFLGYQTYQQPTFSLLPGQSRELEPLVLQPIPNELQEVTVKAQKPLLEVRADKTVFNVDASITAAGSTAFDLLRKSPGVTIDNNDNITLLGRAGIRVYIDGRPSPLVGADLAQFLRNLQSNEIEAIELITNPSAKYDAQGNAGIINIRLKKDKKLGANANINLDYSIGERAWYNGGFNANYRNRKINVFGNYNYVDNYFINYMRMDRRQLGLRFDQFSDMGFQSRNNNFKTGIDFFASKNSTFGALVSGFLADNDFFSSGTTRIGPIATNQVDSILVANSNSTGGRDNLNYNLNYRYDNNQGKSFNVDVDYGSFRNTNQEFQPNYYYDQNGQNLLSSRIFANNSPTDIDIFTFKTDFEDKLWGGQLGAGIKVSWVRTDNTFDFFNVEGPNRILNPDLSNRFIYTENVNAAYLNYSRSIKKFSINAGLRAEQTRSEGDLRAYIPVNDDNVKRDYLGLFPSVGLTYQANERHAFNLSYSRRINRPSYQDLNPFQNRIDELTYEQGNPFLQPEYAQNFQLQHTFLSRFNTTLAYSHTRDQITRFVDTAGTTANFITWLNLADQYAYSLSVSAPVEVRKWWNVFSNLNLTHLRNRADFGENKIVALEQTVFNVYLQNTITLPNKWVAEISGWYSSPGIWGGTFYMNSMWSMDIGLQKKVMGDRGTLKVGLNDVLRTNRWTGNSEFGALFLDISGGWDSRRFKVNFTYALGNTEVKGARRRSTGLEDEQRRIKND